MGQATAVIAFARAPVPGKTKTRLIPALGAEAAAALYRCFLLDVMESLRGLPADVIVAAAAEDDLQRLHGVIGVSEQVRELIVQSGADLGERILHAVRHALQRGYRSAVVIGTDAPDLPTELVAKAVQAATCHELVLGPCSDGGYYLIGLRKAVADLFTGIRWSSADVCSETVKRAVQLGLSITTLDQWEDVDTPDDLCRLAERLARRLATGQPVLCQHTWEHLRTHPECVELARRAARTDGILPATGPRVAVIIPAVNEERSIGRVIEAIPRDMGAQVVVVDNGSTDDTARIARQAGAEVVSEPRRGYGSACLAGIAAVPEAEVIAFLDADLSDDPTMLGELLRPIAEGQADLVVGSRMLGRRERGALPLHSLFGNWLAGFILTHLYHQPTTDLGPFRAIRRSALDRLQMQDRGFGWTMEMQAKAARLRLRTVEVPVPYRKRVGRSKITGSLKASVQAGAIILWTALRLLRWRPEGDGQRRASKRTAR